ncbi:unnamed protein product [Amaranthus hypochondriacus]
MGSVEKGFVHYCCIAKGGKILQTYSGGDHEIETLAALCLELAPLYHRWYSQTMGGRKFFFLMEDGFIYFAITHEGIDNSALFRFLENVRNEFKKITKKGLSRKGIGSNSDQQLVPVIRKLITSLQNVSQTGEIVNGSKLNSPSAPCDAYYGGGAEGATSTKAPLLGNKGLKQEKRGKDHHIIGMRGIELEENRRSTDGGSRSVLESSNAGGVSPLALHKDSMRTRSQTIRRKWCRLVWLVVVTDAAICIVLFLVWLLLCAGFECVRT